MWVIKIIHYTRRIKKKRIQKKWKRDKNRPVHNIALRIRLTLISVLNKFSLK